MPQRRFKNIIFDLGGVILDIDYNKTVEAFRGLGIENAETLYSKSSQLALFDELEKGNISEHDFYHGIRKLSAVELSDEQICAAWNSMLIGLPEINIQVLLALKNEYRLFLLSNTNSIHESGYREMITKKFGRFIFDDIFEKMYLSHRLHMRKPDTEIFLHVLSDSNLLPNETTFIDDSPQHIVGANKAGIKAFHLENKTISDFFQERISEF
jgi:glucose-1-phosphatase